MNERRAVFLVLASSLLLMTGAILGLRAADANEATVTLGAIVPLVLCSYGVSRVVMHFGSSDQRRR